MIQYQVPGTWESCFLDGRLPRLSRVCHIDGDNGWLPRAMHLHGDGAELVYIMDGHGIHMIGDNVYHTGPGDVLIYNVGVPHDERPQGGPLRYFCCGITSLRLKGLAENCIFPPDVEPVLHMGEDGEGVGTLFSMLQETVGQGGQYASEQARFLMISLLLRVLEYAKGHAEPRAAAPYTLGQRIKQYIDENYLQNLTLTSISEHLGISPYYLGRLFKEKTGYSPMQYIINRRMGEAQTLLITTQDSVTRIAERVGYDNPNYFNLLFKKNIGLTPGQYRRVVCAQEERLAKYTK